MVPRAQVPRWVAPAGLFALAAAVRLAFVGTRPYGDEAHHYFVARFFGEGPANLYPPAEHEWLFWWRPLFSLLLSPGAQFGFTGFRVGYMLLAAGIAPVVWWWLRGRGVSRTASILAGIVAALHPFLLVWGVRAFPDGLMVVFYVLGLALWERGRRLAGAVALLAATWVKEVALIGIAVLLAEEVWAALRRDGREVSVRLGVRHAMLAGVLALAYVPHWYAESLGGRSPGWTRGGDLESVLDGAFTTVWFVPVVIAALAWRSSRRPALHALAYLGFYAVYHVAFGGAAERWYFVLPTVLALAAVTALLDALWAQGRAAAAPRLARVTAPVCIAFVVALLAVQAIVPGDVAAKQEALHPQVDIIELSYEETLREERARDHALWDVLAQADATDLQNVLAVDVAWFFSVWPLSEKADFVATAWTEGAAPDWVWQVAVEDIANMTLLRRSPTPLSLALQEVYADCIGAQNAEYVLLRGQGCKGRSEDLRAAYERNLT